MAATGVPPDLEERLAGVRLLVLDFDGVLTDNTVTVTSDGVESVTCWRSDGLGLAALRRDGVDVLVLSTETDPVVGVRCRKLGLDHQQALADKGAALAEVLAARGLAPEHVAYVGNDVNDLGCLAQVGLPVVVADAHEDVRPAAAIVTRLPGGRGAVREVCDLIVRARVARRGAA